MTRDVKSFKIDSVEYFFPTMENPPWKEKEDLFRQLVAPTVANTEEEESRQEKLVGKQKSLNTNAFHSKVTNSKKTLSKNAKIRTDLWTEAVATKTHKKIPSDDEIISNSVPWHTRIKILNENSMYTETASLKACIEEDTSNSIVALSDEEEESSKLVVVRMEMESRLQAAQICFIKDPLKIENVPNHSETPRTQECTVRVKIEPLLEDSIATNVNENTSSVENVTEARYLMQEMCSKESVKNKLREDHSMTDTQNAENLKNGNVRVKQEPLWEETSCPMTVITQGSTRGQTIPITEYTQERSKEAIRVKKETVSNRMAEQGELRAGMVRDSSIDGVTGVSAAAARAGLYAGHEVTGDLVVGPECLHRPSAVFTRETLMQYLSGVEHDHTYASSMQPMDTGELNLLRQMKDCYVRLQRCDEQLKHTLGAEKREGLRRKSNIYMCDSCGKTYQHRWSIVRHIQTHFKPKVPTDINSSIQQKIYECNTCGKIYKDMRNFFRHIHTHDRQEKVMCYKKNTYSCQICKKGFKQSSNLQRHKRTHTGEKPYFCNVCQRRFADVSNLKKHERNHNKDKIFSCHTCRKKFARKDHLEKHIRIHEGLKPHCCKICKKEFGELHNLKKHERNHNKDKIFSCHTCRKKFARKDHLEKHIRIHEGLKPHCCKICKKEFGELHNLKKHERNHNKDKIFSCHTCRKKFARKYHLEKHIHIHEGLKPHCCKICKKEFGELHNLKKHERNHNKDKTFSCHTCSKKFARKDHLEKHIRIHEGLKPHRCKICKKEFGELQNLKRHERIHTGEKPYKCNMCYKQFANSGNLTVHIRIHLNIKPYICEICNRRFRDLSTLKRHKYTHIRMKWNGFATSSSLAVHKRIHSGEKPYTCDICSKQFTRKGTLVTHRRIHSGEKPYTCDICSKRFMRRDTLVIHILAHSGKGPLAHRKVRK